MKVYFNNSCKICRSEINMYKKENIEDIDWIDITNNKEAEKETSKNDKELLRRLHIKENDQVIEGAEAFLYVWKRIPKYKFLYSFFKLPVIFTIFKYGYEIVAYFLYLKNKKQLKIN
ncbi:DCC1-like thiol-disulfide oxidoreductase family protein [Candidatus Pelagibacter sp. HIMB1748]|uniref:DCC1-like thiol-disulfide oxidoreductase family protein n=1 Tax=unclassified Candidatus Pelagibacter TaxID=2647897 RepID=UPI003F878AA5